MQEDVNYFDPGVELTTIQFMHVHGEGKVDNIKLLETAETQGEGGEYGVSLPRTAYRRPKSPVELIQ